MTRTAIRPLLLALALSPAAIATAQQPAPGSPANLQPANLQAVPFTDVRIADPFFAQRRATNTRVTLQHALRQLEETGTLGNFDLAASGARKGHRGYVFQDSDAYKALEAVAYALAEQRDSALEQQFDAIVARIAGAQQTDGYLDTAYTIQKPDRRFTNLRDDHELYCVGHLYEAAAAHFQATGKRNLLEIATRNADLLVRTFGPGPDQRPGYCGHPEIELALVKLARVTSSRDYLELARWFVLQRGSRFFAREHQADPERYDGTYWLDHVPVVELAAIAGHAVRAAYLMSGAVDVAAATGDQALVAMVHRVWRNTIDKNVFVTGGIGPSASNEGFTVDYDLPTHTAYQESCASIALLMWAHRMNLLTADSRYADAMEQALYNAIPAGVQLDGTRFFYVNPLASRGTHHRREWFGCACCPPNLARTFAALGGYACATGDDALFVNLYLRGELHARVGGAPFVLKVETDYPWRSGIELRVVEAPPRELSLRLRRPGWCRQLALSCNGESLPVADGYLSVRRVFRPGDVVKLDLELPVRTLEADPRAVALRGRVAFARGPVVYCAEQCDQSAPVEQLVAAPGTIWNAEPRADLLGGVTVLTGELLDAGPRHWQGERLYREVPPPARVRATLVPYAVWDNRAPGAMAVWLPTAPPPPRIVGPEATAAIEVSFKNWNCDPEGLRDGEEPRRSGDTPPRNCHFWDHKGGTEWAQYSWPEPVRLSGCRLFWFDDTGHGACRLPRAARLLWRDGEQWRPVELQGEGDPQGALPIAADRWCEASFRAVATTALRLEVDQQDGWSSGILEWQVVGAEKD